MKSEQELLDFLKQCKKTLRLGGLMSPCPLNKDYPKFGYCGTCSFPDALRFVLDISYDKPLINENTL